MTAAVPYRETLLEDLRGRVLAPASPASRRLGVEVEVLPVERSSGRVLPIRGGRCSLHLVREHGSVHGWREEPSEHGAPRFHLPDGGVVSFEPGGQIEYSSPPEGKGSEVLRRVDAVLSPLRGVVREAGVSLLTYGLDPDTPLAAAPLQLTGPRYRRMADHLARIGPWGARMMRQSVALHVNVDFGPDPARSWRVLNAAVPLLTAIFANSPLCEGRAGGWKSVRARAWRELDPGRTGFFPGPGDAAERYLRFALAADDLFADGGPVPFAEAARRGVTQSEWERHLSTLFPEVRPKGYLEVRCFDAVPTEWLAAPLVLVTALTYDGDAAGEAEELLGVPEEGTLRTGGREGLGDPELAKAACRLVHLSLEGAARLEGYWTVADRDRAAEFFDRYTLRSRSPADDLIDARSLPRPA